jgi:uncharacterized delta-60 repeat protein
VGERLKLRRRSRCVGTAGVVIAAMTALLVSPVLAGAGRAGDLDPSFDRNGRSVVSRVHGYANAVDIGRKGRIVVAGTHTVARLRPNGQLDRSFDDDGIARLRFGPYAAEPSFVALGSSSVAVGPKGAVFVAGATCSSPDSCDFAVSRMTPNGELDRSFGQDGTARIGFANPDSSALAIQIVRDGKLVVGGNSCDASGRCDLAIARLDRDGRLNQAFGNGGRVVGSFGRCGEGLGAMATDSQHRIVVGSTCQNHIVTLARFKQNGGGLDTSFGRGGTVTRWVFINQADALAIDSHDRIDLAGRNHKGFGVVRFGRKGKYDSSFGDHGTARADFSKPDYVAVTSAAIDSRGRIVVAGQASGFSFARFKPQGRVDREFGNDGTVVAGRRDSFRHASSVAIDRRDRIVAAGLHQKHRKKNFGLMRLLG